MANESQEKELKITLLGSNSGRNAGDAAILASIMHVLSEELDGKVSFEVPTTHPDFVRREYGERFNVKAISVMPWTGSIRLLGLPTFRSIRRTDLTFITDGIIFDINLFNPLFNFLITLVFLVPWARLCGKKVVCYDVGIGPLRSFWGRTFARWVGNACDLIMVRDKDSKKLFEEIGVTKEIHLTADAVFYNWGAEDQRAEELIEEAGLSQIVEENRLFGVNVTRYVDRWLGEDEKVSAKEEFLPMLSRVLLRLKCDHGIEPAIFITQVMDGDFGRRLQALLSQMYQEKSGETWTPAFFSNEVLNNHEILALSRRCRLYTGMRVHSLIISARAGTPVVGMVYAPKVRSFLHLLNTPAQALELSSLSEDSMYQEIVQSWGQSEELKNTQQQVARELELQAKRAAEMIRKRYVCQSTSGTCGCSGSKTAVNQ